MHVRPTDLETDSAYSTFGSDPSLRIPTPDDDDVNQEELELETDARDSQALVMRSDEGAPEGKGKEKMTFSDEDFARSVFAMDALEQLEAYLSSLRHAPPGENDRLLEEFLEDQAFLNDEEIITKLAETLRPLQAGETRGESSVSVDDDDAASLRTALDSAILPFPYALPPPPRPSPPMRWLRLSGSEENNDKLCCVCRNQTTGKLIKLGCGSKYDEDCLKAMFEANVNDEYRFPPRCCGQVVPLSYVEDQLSQETLDLYKAKIEEYATPSRLYCSNVQCAQFLGARKDRAESVTCGACSTETCGLCTAPSHPSTKCKVDKGVRKALKLGQSNGWQRCPRCRQLVERNNGCFHMSCRCGKQFCYLCAGEWGLCKCYKRRFFIKALLSKWLHLRGNYLVKDEPAAKASNPVTRAWENVKKAVSPGSTSAAAA